MRAVHLVYQGWSTRKVGRYFGVGSSAVSKWVKKDKDLQLQGWRPIPTRSSKPKSHPNQLKQEMVMAIVNQRRKHNRCAEIVHRELFNQGIAVSLSSVKRTLDREGLLRKYSPWKKFHRYSSRPEVIKAGDLVQIDTIHIMKNEKERIYVYTLLDVFSRWTFAWVSERLSVVNSLKFVKLAQEQSSFRFQTLQSDHGPEFSKFFTKNIQITHRHSRVRQPNDNAHLERFNRTLQEECLNKMPPDVAAYNEKIPEYLYYYNNQRLHLGLNFKTPLECVQAID